MTDDNHPTAAALPSGTESFIDLKGLAMQAGSWFDRKDLTLGQREDMVADLIKFAVLGYLENSAMKKLPVPSDMAEDVAIINVVLDIAYDDFNHHNKALDAKKALDRIVAHLSQPKGLS